MADAYWLISQRPLFEHLFDLFLDFTQIDIPQIAPTTCLGELIRPHSLSGKKELIT